MSRNAGAIVAACSAVSGSVPPPDNPPPDDARCPRCGGIARQRKRRGGWANPFLPKAKIEITCEDCGLDFDPAQRLSDAPRSSGQAPWGKP